jgi:hypothetical protein
MTDIQFEIISLEYLECLKYLKLYELRIVKLVYLSACFDQLVFL